MSGFTEKYNLSVGKVTNKTLKKLIYEPTSAMDNKPPEFINPFEDTKYIKTYQQYNVSKFPDVFATERIQFEEKNQEFPLVKMGRDLKNKPSDSDTPYIAIRTSGADSKQTELTIEQIIILNKLFSIGRLFPDPEFEITAEQLYRVLWGDVKKRITKEAYKNLYRIISELGSYRVTIFYPNFSGKFGKKNNTHPGKKAKENYEISDEPLIDYSLSITKYAANGKESEAGNCVFQFRNYFPLEQYAFDINETARVDVRLLHPKCLEFNNNESRLIREYILKRLLEIKNSKKSLRHTIALFYSKSKDPERKHGLYGVLGYKINSDGSWENNILHQTGADWGWHCKHYLYPEIRDYLDFLKTTPYLYDYKFIREGYTNNDRAKPFITIRMFFNGDEYNHYMHNEKEEIMDIKEYEEDALEFVVPNVCTFIFENPTVE